VNNHKKKIDKMAKNCNLQIYKIWKGSPINSGGIIPFKRLTGNQNNATITKLNWITTTYRYQSLESLPNSGGIIPFN